MAYAYCDKHGTLHIVEKMNTALDNSANGNVVETNYPHDGGYPVHKDKHIFVYIQKGEAYIGGNTPAKGKLYNVDDDLILREIVRKVKGR